MKPYLYYQACSMLYKAIHENDKVLKEKAKQLYSEYINFGGNKPLKPIY